MSNGFLVLVGRTTTPATSMLRKILFPSVTRFQSREIVSSLLSQVAPFRSRIRCSVAGRASRDLILAGHHSLLAVTAQVRATRIQGEGSEPWT